MATRHVVVDGSNLATEGRSMPSLAQLDTAVREFLQENPDDMVTVVVDASFGHRIDPSEFKVFEEAESAGEVVSPPAGAIGRGDAFLLRIADKTGATVLSNDSFQEFHGDYEWLFERGRLIGGKPVPGVGWIFTPRTPVRGPRSREAVKEAKRKTKTADSDVPGLDLAASRTRGKGRKTVEKAIAVAMEEAVAPKEKSRRRRKGGTPPADPVNDPLTFITFIAAHPLGAEVTATVESFASHGAFVECEGARCYVPLSAMGEPPPKSAREIFNKGEEVRLVVQALDPHRRGVELALPGHAKIAGAPTDETVEAEIGSGETEDRTARPRAATARSRAGADGSARAAGGGADGSARAGAEVADGAAPVVAAGAVAPATAAPARRARKRAPAAAAAAPSPDVAAEAAPSGRSGAARRRKAKEAPSVPPAVESAKEAPSVPPAVESAEEASVATAEPAGAATPGRSEAARPASSGRRRKTTVDAMAEPASAGTPAAGQSDGTQPPAVAERATRSRTSSKAGVAGEATTVKPARSRASAKTATPESGDTEADALAPEAPRQAGPPRKRTAAKRSPTQAPSSDAALQVDGAERAGPSPVPLSPSESGMAGDGGTVEPPPNARRRRSAARPRAEADVDGAPPSPEPAAVSPPAAKRQSRKKAAPAASDAPTT